MDALRRMAFGGLLAGLACATLGCQSMTKMNPKEVWHNVQPHRLQMLNRGAPAMSSDAYFSVLDRTPGDGDATELRTVDGEFD